MLEKAGRARAVYGVIIFRSWSDQGVGRGRRARPKKEEVSGTAGVAGVYNVVGC